MRGTFISGQGASLLSSEEQILEKTLIKVKYVSHAEFYTTMQVCSDLLGCYLVVLPRKIMLPVSGASWIERYPDKSPREYSY